MMLVYQWRKRIPRKEVQTAYVPGLYFAKQTGIASWPVQALANVALNLPDAELGDALRKLRDLASSLDPKARFRYMTR